MIVKKLIVPKEVAIKYPEGVFHYGWMKSKEVMGKKGFKLVELENGDKVQHGTDNESALFLYVKEPPVKIQEAVSIPIATEEQNEESVPDERKAEADEEKGHFRKKGKKV